MARRTALALVVVLTLAACETDQERSQQTLAQARTLLADRPADAIPLLEQAVALDATSREAHALLGRALLAEARFTDAAREIDAAVALGPATADDAETLARARIGLSEWERAVVALEEALALDASRSALSAELGRAYEHLDRVADAETAYRGALAADGTRVAARLALTRMLLTQAEARPEPTSTCAGVAGAVAAPGSASPIASAAASGSAASSAPAGASATAAAPASATAGAPASAAAGAPAVAEPPRADIVPRFCAAGAPTCTLRDEARALIDDAAIAEGAPEHEGLEGMRVHLAELDAARDQACLLATAERQRQLAGILGILSASAWDSLASSPFGRDDALRDEGLLDGMMGDSIGDSFGYGGLGLTGTGGSGGTGDETIGLGNIGTIGGAGAGSWYGTGPRAAAGPTARIGTPVVRGTLDAAVVRRILVRHIDVLRHCYEQALNASPALAGTVTATFTIDAVGSVTSSSASGMPAVEACIVSAARRWVFPTPASGVAIVTVPVTFANVD